MYSKEMNEKQHTSWMLAAMAAPVTHAASNCSWPAVAVVGILCLAIRYGVEKLDIDRTPGKWLGAIQWLWMLLVVSEFMHWIMYCWPERKSYHVIPLVLLILAAYTVSRGASTAHRAGSTLRMPIGVLIGVILLSGIREICPGNLMPVWQMQTAHLISVMLIPVMGLGYGVCKKKTGVLAYGVVVSVITTGVLSLDYIRLRESPFYDMSRSIHVLGTDSRLESMVAAGMTLGYYVLLTYLIGITANAWEPEKQRVRSIWISALFAGLVFVSGMRLNSRLLAIGNLLIWAVFPIVKNIGKNIKKVLDKRER